MELAIDDNSRLGIDPSACYQITEGLRGTGVGQRTGAELLAQGLAAPIEPLSPAVLVLDPCP